MYSVKRDVVDGRYQIQMEYLGGRSRYLYVVYGIENYYIGRREQRVYVLYVVE